MRRNSHNHHEYYVSGHRSPENLYALCLGADYAFQIARAVAHWCGCPPPTPAHINTKIGHREYDEILYHGSNHYLETGLRCSVVLVPELIGFENHQIELIYPNGRKNCFWLGTSSKWLPAHLELRSKDEKNGPVVYFPKGTTIVRK